VPVPDPVVGSAYRQRVTLSFLKADRETDRPLKPGGIEILLDHEVSHTQRAGLEIDLVGGLPGDNDHGRKRTRPKPLTHQLEPRMPAKPIVDQVHVVALLADRHERLVVR
jgi:hypothetical protein